MNEKKRQQIDKSLILPSNIIENDFKENLINIDNKKIKILNMDKNEITIKCNENGKMVKVWDCNYVDKEISKYINHFSR